MMSDLLAAAAVSRSRAAGDAGRALATMGLDHGQRPSAARTTDRLSREALELQVAAAVVSTGRVLAGLRPLVDAALAAAESLAPAGTNAGDRLAQSRAGQVLHDLDDLAGLVESGAWSAAVLEPIAVAELVRHPGVSE